MLVQWLVIVRDVVRHNLIMVNLQLTIVIVRDIVRNNIVNHNWLIITLFPFFHYYPLVSHNLIMVNIPWISIDNHAKNVRVPSQTRRTSRFRAPGDPHPALRHWWPAWPPAWAATSGWMQTLQGSIRASEMREGCTTGWLMIILSVVFHYHPNLYDWK